MARKDFSKLPIRQIPMMQNPQKPTPAYESHYNPSLKGCTPVLKRHHISATDEILHRFGLVDDSGKISALEATALLIGIISGVTAGGLAAHYLQKQPQTSDSSDTAKICKGNITSGGIGMSSLGGMTDQTFIGCVNMPENLAVFSYKMNKNSVVECTRNKDIVNGFCGKTSGVTMGPKAYDEKILEIKFPDVSELYAFPTMLCDVSPGTCKDFGEKKVRLIGVGDKVRLLIGDKYSTVLELKGYSKKKDPRTPIGISDTAYFFKDGKPTLEYGWDIGREYKMGDFDIHVEDIIIDYTDRAGNRSEKPLVKLAIRRHIEKALDIPRI